MKPELIAHIAVFSDSKSVLECLSNHSLTTNAIKDLITSIDQFASQFKKEITLQWIPSHCNIDGNESADKLAKVGSMMD